MATRVLVFGGTGMLGHMLLREFEHDESVEVHGAVRNLGSLEHALSADLLKRVATGVDAMDVEAVRALMRDVKPHVVINCVGVIKQDARISDAISTIKVNSLFPHMLARECVEINARLIHVSTDCVFSGDRGNYVEEDTPDPRDLYGRSKLLGEVTIAPALTLRTSIVGHELGSNRSLVDWFLSQSGTVNGYTRAIYSGLTTTEFARVLSSFVFPREQLTGLLHVASDPISKYDLLRLVASEYEWRGNLVPFPDYACDRSLSAEAFRSLTDYRAPSWTQMIKAMHDSKPMLPML